MMKRTTGPVSLTWGTPECIGYAELEQVWKYMTISFHPCRSTGKQIWPCHKNGQGQPCDIVWTNLVEIVYPMLYTKFQGHRPLGSEEDFWRFLPYMARTLSEHLNKFSSQHPMEAPYEIWLQTALCILRKKFENVDWVTLDKGHWMTLTLGCHVVMYSFIWLYVPTFTSQASTVSRKSKLSIFPYKNKREQIWSSYKNRSWSTEGHHLIKFDSTRVTNAAYQVSRSSAFWFQRWFFKSCYLIRAWRPSWSCDITIPPSHGDSTWNLASIGLAVSKKKKFENVESEWPWTKVIWYSYRFKYSFS